MNMTDTAITLPDSPRDREILRRRAIRLASETGKTGTADRGELFLAVRLGAGELYGIPYACLEEIIRPRGLTRVPGSPGFIAGVLSRRGQLIAVVSLRELFPMADREEPGDEARVVVVRSASLTVGLLVDGVEGNGHWDAAGLNPAPPSTGVRDPSWIAGIHDGRVAMLAMDNLLAGISIETSHE